MDTYKQTHIRFDWAIKRVLRNKANFGILEGFLSVVLNEKVTITEILDGESNQAKKDQKYNRVDIFVKNSKGELIIIEVQTTYAIDYFLRMLFAQSKAIVEHLGSGQKYKNIKKVYSISIVYFDLGHGIDYVYRGGTKFFGIHNNDELQLSQAQKELFKKESITALYPESIIIKVNDFDDVAKS